MSSQRPYTDQQLPTDLENFRYKFCKTFLRATDQELSTTLKDPSTSSKVAQCFVTAFCSGVSLAAQNPEMGKAAAMAVNVLVRKCDALHRQKKTTAIETMLEGQMNTREFQSAFRKLMLKSAIEIWHCYENQLMSVRQKKVKARSASFIKTVKRAVSWEAKEKEAANASAHSSKESDFDETVSDSRKSGKNKFPHMQIQKLAHYAAARCVEYLVENEKCDFPHKFLPTIPNFVDKAKAKYEHWFEDRIFLELAPPVVAEDSKKEVKSTVEFFVDPLPVFFHQKLHNKISEDFGTTAFVWKKDFLAKNSEAQLTIKQITETDNKNLELPPLLRRRPFDFERTEFSSSLLETILEPQSEQILTLILKDSKEMTYFSHQGDDDGGRCDMVTKMYNELSRDPDFDKDEALFNSYSEMVEILSQTCVKMDQFQKFLTDFRDDLQKILHHQTQLSDVMTEVQERQQKIDVNVQEVKDTGVEVRTTVEEIKSEQSDMMTKIDEIHRELFSSTSNHNHHGDHDGNDRRDKNNRRTKQSSSSAIIKNFSMTEAPPSLFTGREKTMRELSQLLKMAEGERPVLKRIVVISGLGGIGKSSLAKKYAQQFKNEHKGNIAWFNAEAEDSLQSSFFSLAVHFKICDHILKKKGEHRALSKNDVAALVREVYHHFSRHVGRGLFIFDNANQMRSTRDEFGIQDFLPAIITQSHHDDNDPDDIDDDDDDRYPVFLLTSRNQSWPMTPYKIQLDRLAEDETVAFLGKGLPGNFNLNLNNAGGPLSMVEKSIQNLGKILDGHPLALNLAAAAISQNVGLLGGGGYHDNHYDGDEDAEKSKEFLSIVESEIGNYVAMFNEDGSSWVNYEAGGDDYTPMGGKYDKIMATVWEGTMDKLMMGGKRQSMAAGVVATTNNEDLRLSEMVIDLLNMVAYLPTDLISVELCHCIYHNIQINEELFFYQTAHVKQSKVRKAFGILEKYSMVSILPQKFHTTFPHYQEYGASSVRVHRLVQKWTREKNLQKGQFTHLLKLAHYFQNNMFHPDYYDCLREHLKEIKWPEQSYRFCIFNHHFGTYPKGKWPWEELLQVFLQKNELQNSDKEYWTVCNLALSYYQLVASNGAKNDLAVTGETIFGKDGGQNNNGIFKKGVTLEKIFDLTLDYAIKYPGNPLLHQIAKEILFHVKFQKMIEKNSKKLRQWIRSHLAFLKETPSIVPPVLSPYRRMPMLDLAAKLISDKELIESVVKIVDFRLHNDGHLHCLTLLSKTLLKVQSWPVDVWEGAATLEYGPSERVLKHKAALNNRKKTTINSGPCTGPQDDKEALRLLKIFLSNGGLRLLTRALVRYKEILSNGHFLEMRHMVIFGAIQNLAYFDKIAKITLESTEFKEALSDVFDAATKQVDRTVNDRRALVGIVFSWYALLANKNRLKKCPLDTTTKVRENMAKFVVTLEERPPSVDLEAHWNGCPAYVLEIRHGRFSSSREGIIHTFLASHDENSADILFEAAGKLGQILDTKCQCFHVFNR